MKVKRCKNYKPGWHEFVTFVPKDWPDKRRTTIPVRDIDEVFEDGKGKFFLAVGNMPGTTPEYVELDKTEYVSVLKQLGFESSEK